MTPALARAEGRMLPILADALSHRPSMSPCPNASWSGRDVDCQLIRP